MKYLSVFSLFLINISAIIAQEIIKSPSSFFPKEKTEVLVVGTFHFDYPNLDVNKIAAANKIDVLKEPKSSEVTELINYIKKFKPTKIAIEAKPSWEATLKLRKYQSGAFRDRRDERYQLAMRLATEIGLDTLYSIDGGSFMDDLEKIDSAFAKKLLKDYDFNSNDKYNAMVKDWYDYEEKLPPTMTLLNYFKRINSKESHQLGYGAYLIGDFKLDNQRGADIISLWWYNRNMRIFRKLQEITEGPKDRILVIFGNAHAAVLRSLLESSPAYQFVEFESLK